MKKFTLRLIALALICATSFMFAYGLDQGDRNNGYLWCGIAIIPFLGAIACLLAASAIGEKRARANNDCRTSWIE